MCILFKKKFQLHWECSGALWWRDATKVLCMNLPHSFLLKVEIFKPCVPLTVFTKKVYLLISQLTSQNQWVIHLLTFHHVVFCYPYHCGHIYKLVCGRYALFHLITWNMHNAVGATMLWIYIKVFLQICSWLLCHDIMISHKVYSYYKWNTLQFNIMQIRNCV